MWVTTTEEEAALLDGARNSLIEVRRSYALYEMKLGPPSSQRRHDTGAGRRTRWRRTAADVSARSSSIHGGNTRSSTIASTTVPIRTVANAATATIKLSRPIQELQVLLQLPP